MKKFRILACALLATGFGLTSCSSDDDTGDVNSEVQREAQDLLNNVLMPYTRKNIEKFRTETVSGNVVELESTDHYCFIQRREEIAQLMREFLLAE